MPSRNNLPLVLAVSLAVTLPVLAGCIGDPRSRVDELPDLSGRLPTTGELIGSFESFRVVEERPERGMLIIEPPPGWRQDQASVDVYLVIFSGDGERHDQEFRIEPEDVRSLNWVNFTYPSAPAPYLVKARANTFGIHLHNDPTVSMLDWSNRYVVDDSCLDEERPRCDRFHVEYRVSDVPGSLAGERFHDEVTFHVNRSVINLVVYLEDNSLNGTAWLESPSGRNVVYVERDGQGPTHEFLSNGSMPIEPGTWRLVMEGSGSLEIRLDSWYLKPEAWGAYGFQRPTEATTEPLPAHGTTRERTMGAGPDQSGRQVP